MLKMGQRTEVRVLLMSQITLHMDMDTVWDTQDLQQVHMRTVWSLYIKGIVKNRDG